MNHDDPRDGTFHDDAFGYPVDTLDDRLAPRYLAFKTWMEEFVYCEHGVPAPPNMMLKYAPYYLRRYLRSRRG